VLESPAEPELLDALTGIAAAVTGRSLEVAGVRALRLRPGDHLLVRHDRVHEGQRHADASVVRLVVLLRDAHG